MSAELIAKLESASEGSRELDDLVLKGTGHAYHMDFGPGFYDRPGHTYRIYGNGQSQVTTSIDAALALAERVLGSERKWELSFDAERAWAECAPSWWKPHHDEDATDAGGVCTTASTLPIAICAALLAAATVSNPRPS